MLRSDCALLAGLALLLTACTRPAQLESIPTTPEATKVPATTLSSRQPLATSSPQPASRDQRATPSPQSPVSGTQLAFVSDRDGYPVIYGINADGTGLVRLVDDIAGIMNPAWSPDGSQLAFTAYSPDGQDFSTYVVNAAGAGRTEISRGNGNALLHWGSGWSPDGTHYAYNEGSQIFAKKMDGSGVTQLTDEPIYAAFPAWSPDGEKIAYASYREDGGGDILVMDADGANPRNLTQEVAGHKDNNCPTWSPDGKRIAYLSSGLAGQPDIGGDIILMKADGALPVNLTEEKSSFLGCPAWSPDGARLAYASNRDGNYEIYVINADGGGRTRLTDQSTLDGFPTWNPAFSSAAVSSVPEPTITSLPLQESPGDADLARKTLMDFFTFLHDGQYEQAAELFGGSYEVLTGWNPTLDPRDLPTLLRNGCELNGLQCLLVKSDSLQEQISPTGYTFTVEFANEDGSLFVSGPCCGANATEMPPVSQFSYTVGKGAEGQFRMQDFPPYLP